MMVDPETVKNLELIKNAMSRKSSHTLFGHVPLSPDQGPCAEKFWY